MFHIQRFTCPNELPSPRMLLFKSYMWEHLRSILDGRLSTAPRAKNAYNSLIVFAKHLLQRFHSFWKPTMSARKSFTHKYSLRNRHFRVSLTTKCLPFSMFRVKKKYGGPKFFPSNKFLSARLKKYLRVSCQLWVPELIRFKPTHAKVKLSELTASGWLLCSCVLQYLSLRTYLQYQARHSFELDFFVV